MINIKKSKIVFTCETCDWDIVNVSDGTWFYAHIFLCLEALETHKREKHPEEELETKKRE